MATQKITEVMIEKAYSDIGQLIQDSEIIALKDKIKMEEQRLFLLELKKIIKLRFNI